MAISHCYCYSLSRQIKWQITPQSIEHRCLEDHYTKLTITPYLADLLADLPPSQSSIDALSTFTPIHQTWQIYPSPTQTWISGCCTEKYAISYQSRISYNEICISGIEKYRDCTISEISLSLSLTLSRDLLAKGENNTETYLVADQLVSTVKAHIGRSSGISNTPSRSASSSEWPFLISIMKAHTTKCQIYPDDVFYAKDLLPGRVPI